MYKIKSYHRKTAIKGTLNKAVDRMISASGLTEKWDPDKGPRPIFVVGDGNFGSSNGPLLHQQFVTHLKKKVCVTIVRRIITLAVVSYKYIPSLRSRLRH